MVRLISGPWWAVFLAFPTLLYLWARDLKARDLLVSAVASALACFLSKELPQLQIQPWHVVIKGQGRAGGAAVCATRMGSSGEAHL